MLGIHKYNPQDKYLRDVSNEQEVFKLSSEELDIEERRAELSIENTDAIRELTAVLLRNMITEDGRSTEYKLYKYVKDEEKKAKENGEEISPEEKATISALVANKSCNASVASTPSTLAFLNALTSFISLALGWQRMMRMERICFSLNLIYLAYP